MSMHEKSVVFDCVRFRIRSDLNVMAIQTYDLARSMQASGKFVEIEILELRRTADALSKIASEIERDNSVFIRKS